MNHLRAGESVKDSSHIDMLVDGGTTTTDDLPRITGQEQVTKV